MKLNSRYQTLFYTAMHFLVDGICGLLVFNHLYDGDYSHCLTLFLVYNLLAFLFQPVVGLLIDRFNHDKYFLASSMVLITLGILAYKTTVLSALLLGLGNAFFHVTGGKSIANTTKNNIVHLGIFVSSGAVGLVIGEYFNTKYLLPIFIGLALLFFVLIMLFKYNEEKNNLDKPVRIKTKYAILILVCFVVFIRSFLGKLGIYEGTMTVNIILITSMAAFLGKAIGGVIYKYAGGLLTIICSTIGSTIFLLIAPHHISCYIIGILFFNLTMPITLYFANRLLAPRYGLSFGLIAALLIPGYFLGMLKYNSVLTIIFIVLSGIVSLLILIYSKRELDYDHN